MGKIVDTMVDRISQIYGSEKDLFMEWRLVIYCIKLLDQRCDSLISSLYDELQKPSLTILMLLSFTNNRFWYVSFILDYFA